MKNSFKIFFFVFILNFPNLVFSSPFNFETKNIEILDNGEKINAFKGKIISDDKNLELYSDEFTYLKNLDLLKAIGNGELIIKSKRLKINFDKAILKQNNTIFEAEGNVEINSLDNDYNIKTNKIFYNLKDDFIKSETTTRVEDGLDNLYLFDSFNFEIEKNIIRVKNLIGKDLDQNTFKTKIAYINTKSGKIFGKDVQINLKNPLSENVLDYKLRGNSVEINKNNSKITKGIFTTCKTKNNCPPWQFNAKKIHHDKVKNEISYDDAFLQIYNFPIAYFPKFYHPDPTVKRRSGFLIPSIQTGSNSDNFLNLPYYFVVAENKDMTLYPRLYADNKFLLQTEYRQKNFKSDHLADLSFLNESKNNNNHFFYEYKKNLNYDYFKNGNLNFKMQSTSSNNYIKSNKLKSKLIADNNILENSFNLELFSNNTSLEFNSTIFENMNKDTNDRYEFIYPSLKLTKNLENFKNSGINFTFDTENIVRHFNTNVYEKRNTNNFIFSSKNKKNDLGFLNNHEFIVKNTNSENKNTNYKNSKSFYLSSLYQYNLSLPLIKNNDIKQNILEPKLSFKAAPNHTKNERDITRRIDNTNIFSINRATDKSSVEGGNSLAYGLDYYSFNKERNRNTLSLKLANNLRLKKNDNLINTNQIGEKTSNFFSEVSYDPNNYLNFKYNSAIKNNLKDLSYENLVTEFQFSDFTTSFDYLNNNDNLKKNSYISNITTYSFNQFNDLSFSTRKNKTKDLTEYYNFMYQYKNDCLAASIEYKKDFYNDGVSQNSDSLFFKLSIIPFVDLNSPQLN